MKKEITLEDIKSINFDDLAKMLCELITTDEILHEKIEKLLLLGDPSKLYKNILKSITAIKRGRKFIHYSESFQFSKKIAMIVQDIDMLVQDNKSASKLLKELILTDSKVYLRCDDSSGTVQVSYAMAKDAWKERAAKSLKNDELLQDLEDLLICDGFGMRDIFSVEFPKDVLHELYDKCHLSFTLENEEFEKSSLFHVLLEIANYLKSPSLYIETKKLSNKPFTDNDNLDIAEQFKQIEDAKNTLLYLKKIETSYYRKEELFKMLIWAYEKLNQPLNITSTYKQWYEKTKSTEIFKCYLAQLNTKEKEQATQKILEELKTSSFSQTLNFYVALDKKSLCASYIINHQDKIDTTFFNYTFLKSTIAWLEDSYPQEAILLYRDICKKALETSQSKYYKGAISALKKMVELEAKNTPLIWKIEENYEFIDNLLHKHKQKRKFLELFDKAF